MGWWMRTNHVPRLLGQGRRGTPGTRAFTTPPAERHAHLVRPGRVTPKLEAAAIPHHVAIPQHDEVAPGWVKPPIYEQAERDAIGRSAQVARRMLDLAQSLAQPGVTTEAMDKAVTEAMFELGAYPSPLNFQGFPKSISTSVNNVACHGVPDDRELVLGDLMTVDVAVFFQGFHSDVSRSFFVGEHSDLAGRHLISAAQECLYQGISACGPGVPFRRIGQVIAYVAHRRGVKIIPNLCGHGIGRQFHASPDVYHVPNNYPGVMQPGHVFTIEPCVTLGQPGFRLLEDNLTIVTADGERSAQFEHTLLVTERGVDILTAGIHSV
eukprot:snap_masked-scaffold487_size158652-processed-gene-0.15 protein:Tk00171 transcript:snap_masked-scaffold487_size158652-processed-gene-0.15-mRNA-1 annotation:"methionine aminopeptidase mitochondrial"